MQTIIQNKLSEMLDELLEKALEEKPKIIYEDFNKHTDNLKNYKRILKEAIKLKKQIEQKQYAI